MFSLVELGFQVRLVGSAGTYSGGVVIFGISELNVPSLSHESVNHAMKCDPIEFAFFASSLIRLTD